MLVSNKLTEMKEGNGPMFHAINNKSGNLLEKSFPTHVILSITDKMEEHK